MGFSIKKVACFFKKGIGRKRVTNFCKGEKGDMKQSLIKEDLGIDDVVFSRILDEINEGVCFVGRGRKILYWNKAAERITGYTEEDILGTKCTGEWFDFVDKEGNQYCTDPCPAVRAIAEGVTFQKRVYLKTKGERRLPVDIKVIPFKFNGKVIGSLEIFSDASMYEILEANIAIDPLTRFPLWQEIQTNLDYEDERVARYGIPFCLLVVVADQIHEMEGDDDKEFKTMVLESLADHLRNNVRKADLICRHEDDKFVVLMPHTSKIGAIQLAERLRSSVEQSSPSMTITQCVTDRKPDETVYDAIKRADENLTTTQQKGKNNIQFVD
jgi:diguanylate cyclase (GGDEF)-like protein/PAS domain S-box-containing protein